MDLSRVTIVLDKVRHPDNLGAALRAMKNSGLSRIVLSEPFTRDFDQARKMATDADDLLEGMKVVESLPEAVAHGTLVAGTTSRGPEKRPALWLREFVERAAAETDSGGEVVVVFGNERRGLSDEELDHCQLVVNIPTAPAKSSINLAQSVMLVSHSLFEAAFVPPAPQPRPPPANARLLQALFAKMQSVLVEADFLNRQNPDAIHSELKRLVERAGPSQREAELLLTAFKHVERAMGAVPRKDQRAP